MNIISIPIILYTILSLGISGHKSAGTVLYEAIFSVKITLHSLYIGLKYGRYCQFI